MALPAVLMAAMRAAGGAGARGMATETLGSTFSSSASSGGANRAIATWNKETQRGQTTWEKFGKNIREVNEQLAYANVNMHQMAGKIAAIPQRFVQTLTAAIDIVQASAAPFLTLVQGHNPGVAKQFTLAIHDAYGVLGRAFVPVLQSFTGVARKLGDWFAGMEPIIAKLSRGIAFFVEKVGGRLIEAFQRRAGLLEFVATMFERAATAAAFFVTSILDVVDFALKPLFKALNALGFGDSFDKNATAVGAGTREIKASAAKEISDEAIKNALMRGDAGQSPAEKQVGYLEQLALDVADIKKKILSSVPSGPVDAVKKGNPIAVGKGVAEHSPLYALWKTS